MVKKRKFYYLRTFGCLANVADSQRIAKALEKQGFCQTSDIKKADLVVVNSCIVRQSAENRVYGFLNKFKNPNSKFKARSASRRTKQIPNSKSENPNLLNKFAICNLQFKNGKPQVLLTGCLAGWALRDQTGKNLKILRKKIGQEVEVILTEDLAGFSISPNRNCEKLDSKIALVPISWGCSHFCSYCVVPYARGLVKHRPFREIISEVKEAVKQGRKHIILLGENVNAWREKFGTKNLKAKTARKKKLEFSDLLAAVAEIPGVELVEFMSPNPAGFSNKLVETIAKYPNISKAIHLPLQSGDDGILKRMNRPYKVADYLKVVKNLQFAICNLKLSTDLIVGFPGETEKAFENTVKICQKIGFVRAFISRYSSRPGTMAAKLYKDDVLPLEKKRRWLVLEKMINGSKRV